MTILFLILSFSFDSLTIKRFSKLLDTFDLDLSALNFPKIYVDKDKFLLKRIENFLETPLSALSFLDSLFNETRKTRDIYALMERSLDLLEYPSISTFDDCSYLDLFSLLDSTCFYLDLLENKINELLKSFPSEKLDTILYGIGSFLEDEEDPTDDSLANVFVYKERGKKFEKKPQEIEFPYLSEFFEKLQLSQFAQYYMRIVEFLISIPQSAPNLPKLEEPFQYLSYNKKVIILDDKDNVVTEKFDVIIDIGGNDRYLTSSQIIIDFLGNDVYHSKESESFGGAFLGVSLVIDLKGDDIYLAGPVSLGTGIVGLGILWDKSGNDIYQGESFSMGVGLFGIGILLDEDGNDTYRGVSWSQGVGFTRGVGILLDNMGNDSYYVGGHYLHKPLHENRYRSFGQGFGFGFRPYASGGYGILVDMSGNDIYYSEVYGQGSAYWLSCGILLDFRGSDSYISHQYALGAGIHLACGIVRDLLGDDHYVVRFGPSVGEGHDLSVGILIDDEGNDYYMVSGGIGVGLNSSVGIFIDKGGDDIYSVSETVGLGYATESRGLLGIGVFIDGGGNDVYPQNKLSSNNKIWIHSFVGGGLDEDISEKSLEQRD